ncbi:MAG TPA: phosphatidylglycerophosphatase A [bacterium]|nr:phosphatidylglycerophosphatase A [bacterium]
MRQVILFLASGGGAGYIPFAPGTWGSAVGLLAYWLLLRLPQWPLAVTVAAFVFLSCWIAGLAEEFLAAKDPQVIVIDEVSGMLVALMFLPASWRVVLAAFVLFRLFDVWKPFPVRWIQENLPGGWGVVGDDIMAGIYANLVLQIALRAIR